MTEGRPYLAVYYHHLEHRMNVSVIADRILFAGDPAYRCTLVLLSVLGPHSAVRGILAAAASQREIRCDAWPTARLCGTEGGRLLTAALSKEVTHGCYLGPELLLGASGRIAVAEDTPRKVFDRLNHAFAIPALPEWDEYLHAALKQERELVPLNGRGATGCLVNTSEDRIDGIISRGIREGAIRF